MTRFTNLKKLSLLLLLPLALDSCTTIQPLSAENQKQIHSIELNKQASEPKKLVLMDPSISFVGPLIAGIADESAATKLQITAEKNGYSPGQIMLAELKKSIQANTKFKITENAKDADAVLKLDINAYGFAIPHGFAMSMAPVLNVDATLFRNNVAVWHFKNREPVIDVTRVTMNQLERDPKAMYVAWDAAAKSLAQKMTASM